MRECNALAVAILAVSAASETPPAAVEDDDTSEPAPSAESAAPPVPDTVLLDGRRDGRRRGGAQGVPYMYDSDGTAQQAFYEASRKGPAMLVSEPGDEAMDSASGDAELQVVRGAIVAAASAAVHVVASHVGHASLSRTLLRRPTQQLPRPTRAPTTTPSRCGLPRRCGAPPRARRWRRMGFPRGRGCAATWRVPSWALTLPARPPLLLSSRRLPTRPPRPLGVPPRPRAAPPRPPRAPPPAAWRPPTGRSASPNRAASPGSWRTTRRRLRGWCLTSRAAGWQRAVPRRWC